MTDVYSIVLCDEILSKPPVASAEIWVHSLLLQLQLDGFDGEKTGIVGTGTISNISLNAPSLGIFFTYIEGILTNTEIL
jgi:hypothetical protein